MRPVLKITYWRHKLSTYHRSNKISKQAQREPTWLSGRVEEDI